METGIKPINYEFNIEEETENILDNFDFDKVHKVMVALDWRWGTGKERELEIPSHYELIKGARERLENAIEFALNSENKEGFSESGGFRGEAWIVDGKLCLSLSFVLESYNNYY